MPKPQLETNLVAGVDDDGRAFYTYSHRIKRTWTIAEGPGLPPTWPLNPSCENCYDMSPPGFVCTECGATPPTPELPSAAQLLASRTP